MGKMQSEKGSHTTVIDPAKKLIRECRGIRYVTGVINGAITTGIKASRSAKPTLTDTSHIRLTVVAPGSKQMFTVCTKAGKADSVMTDLEALCVAFRSGRP